MSLYGVISGIHGNREALAAALAALERRGAERIVCLGDIVGYNADPDECVALVRSRCAVALAGSLDLTALGRRGLGEFPTSAEYSLRRTRRVLGSASKAWLATLPLSFSLEPGVLLAAQAGAGCERVCFHGGSDSQRIVEGESVREIPPHGKVLLGEASPYLISPGSVDASREGSRKLARCALFDSRAWSVEFLRVAYDCASAEAKAAVFGYRASPLADRLYSLRRRFL